MKLTQGCFSFLPDLTDEQITKQIQYAIDKSWAVSIEYTDDPHPRNNYWEMWGLPLFDIKDPAAILFEINMARKAKPNYYVKLQHSITLVVLSLVYFHSSFSVLLTSLVSDLYVKKLLVVSLFTQLKLTLQ